MLPGQQVQPGQQPQQTQYPFYQQLSKALFAGESEISLVDKLLGRQDADKLHQLMKKEPLTKSDIEEILFLMTSIQQKLVNYDEWDRYVIVKLFPWIKDYSTICKRYMIYEEQFEDGEFNLDFTIEVEITIKEQIKPGITITGKQKIDLAEIETTVQARKEAKKIVKPILEETKKIIAETTKHMQHNLKFLVSVFLLVSNSTLSIDGAAFETLSTSRFDYEYHYPNIPQPQQRGSVMNIFTKKK